MSTKLGRRAEKNRPSPLQDQDFVGEIQHHIDVLFDEDAAKTRRLDHVANRVDQFFADARRKPLERFVHEEKRRIGYHRARYRKHLLFAA